MIKVVQAKIPEQIAMDISLVAGECNPDEGCCTGDASCGEDCTCGSDS